MNLSLVATIWLLVVLDCALIGYRLAMGRLLRLDKRRYHLRASLRGGALGMVPLAMVTVLAAWMSRPDGPLAVTEVDQAMVRFVVVGGTYAVVIVAASALSAIGSLAMRTAASVVVFGPLTLLRPVVVVATVAGALGPAPPLGLVALGVLVAVPGVGIEFVMDRRIATQLIAGSTS